MSFNFMNDNEKLNVISDVFTGLIGQPLMLECRAGCVDDTDVHVFHKNYGDECPVCGNPDLSVHELDAETWASFFEMDMAKYHQHGSPHAIFYLPIDAWISTQTDTITVKMKSGMETYPLPSRDKWVFDLEQLYRGRGREKHFRIRKGAVTAA